MSNGGMVAIALGAVAVVSAGTSAYLRTKYQRQQLNKAIDHKLRTDLDYNQKVRDMCRRESQSRVKAFVEAINE